MLNIKYSIPHNQSSLEIFDITGKVVMSENINKTKEGINHKILNISHLEKGVYICRIITDNLAITQKFIKQ